MADWVQDHETMKQVTAAGGEGIFRCNVSCAADVKNMVDKTFSTFGRLDFAFNNAGIEGTYATVDQYMKITGTM